MPQSERCDGIDNDCDGRVDENWSQKGQSCTAGVGECKATGRYVCNAERTGVRCEATLGSPSPELCNGKDDDCNGKIDDVPNSGVACTTSKLGECKTGTTQCDASGQVSCVTPSSVTEICRDGKDNDCDGQTDEICGPEHAYAIVSASGTVSSGRNVRVNSTSTGSYRVTVGNVGNQKCSDGPVFAMAISSSAYAASFECNGVGYQILINHSTSSGQYSNQPFVVVAPRKVSGEIFGIVDQDSCLQSAGQNCTLTGDNGSPSVREASVGVYEITASPCANNAHQPIFVLPHRGSGRKLHSVAVQNGKCMVYLFDASGNPTSNRFAFWLPDISTNAYALIDSTGTVVAKNDFSDQNAVWAGKINTGTPVSMDVTFAAWANPSAALAEPAPTSPAPLLFTAQAATGGIRLFPFFDNSTSTGPQPTTARPAYVLFVQ